jgi:hypothetical protein
VTAGLITLHDLGGGSVALPFMGRHFEGLVEACRAL